MKTYFEDNYAHLQVIYVYESTGAHLLDMRTMGLGKALSEIGKVFSEENAKSLFARAEICDAETGELVAEVVPEEEENPEEDYDEAELIAELWAGSQFLP